jgi:hypothetical protein
VTALEPMFDDPDGPVGVQVDGLAELLRHVTREGVATEFTGRVRIKRVGADYDFHAALSDWSGCFFTLVFKGCALNP